MDHYRPLPKQVLEICRAVKAPPRLIAHLTLVHGVAGELIAELQRAFPDLKFDSDSVLFGAATHDMGKAIHPEELSGPGHKHETDGPGLLQQHGVPQQQARFAYTHANWEDSETIDLEDLLVALADTCWKGKRNPKLEEKIVGNISEKTQKEAWEVFSIVDEILQRIASRADERLAWQAGFATC